MKNKCINLFLLCLLGVFWGSGYVIANYCVRHGIHPFGYGFWQSLGPAVVLLLINLIRKINPIRLEKKYISYYILCGLLGIAFPNTIIYFSSQHLPAGIVGVIANVVPLLIFPMAILAKQEQFLWQRLVAVCIGVLGIMMLVLQHADLNQTVGIPWVVVLLLTPLSFALCSIYIVHARPVPSDSLILSTGMLIMSSVLLIPVVFYTKSFYFIDLPFKTTDWLIILEIGLSTSGYVIFFILIRRAGAIYYSLVSGVVGLTSVVWGRVFLGEKLNLISIGSVTLIILAIVLMSLKANPVKIPGKMAG